MLDIKKDSLLYFIRDCDSNHKMYDKVDIGLIDQDKINTQLSLKDVLSIIDEKKLVKPFLTIEKEIEEEKVNADLLIHGQRHIKNVVLYSTIIGQNVFDNNHDLDLIMISAKYHDVGRKTEYYEDHAGPSAVIAEEKLKGKYSTEDISIIKTIIEFHEVDRESEDVNKIFKQIATKNDIPDDKLSKVRKMADVLKDADALDRTRFVNYGARLDPELLEYDISKNLVKFASSVQETYAIQDLKKYECDNEVNIVLKRNTPQELLRLVQHNTNGYEEVKEYIRLLASDIEKNSKRM